MTTTSPTSAALRQYRDTVLEAIQDVRFQVAADISPACSGALGEARCDSLCDAYVAVRGLALPAETLVPVAGPTPPVADSDGSESPGGELSVQELVAQNTNLRRNLRDMGAGRRDFLRTIADKDAQIERLGRALDQRSSEDEVATALDCLVQDKLELSGRVGDLESEISDVRKSLGMERITTTELLHERDEARRGQLELAEQRVLLENRLVQSQHDHVHACQAKDNALAEIMELSNTLADLRSELTTILSRLEQERNTSQVLTYQRADALQGKAALTDDLNILKAALSEARRQLEAAVLSRNLAQTQAAALRTQVLDLKPELAAAAPDFLGVVIALDNWFYEMVCCHSGKRQSEFGEGRLSLAIDSRRKVVELLPDFNDRVAARQVLSGPVDSLGADVARSQEAEAVRQG